MNQKFEGAAQRGTIAPDLELGDRRDFSPSHQLSIGIGSSTLLPMRIIAGEHRGRRLISPPGKVTRPMLDRIREAMFSTLGPDFDGIFVLDLFAGSGSLGFEAVSRGAVLARFVEEERQIAKLLYQNAEQLGVLDSIDIVTSSALSPATWKEPEGEPARWADIIFFDPPYPLLAGESRAKLFAAVETLVSERLRPNGTLVFHTPKRGVTRIDFSPGLEVNQRVYGSSALWYVSAPSQDDEAQSE